MNATLVVFQERPRSKLWHSFCFMLLRVDKTNVEAVASKLDLTFSLASVNGTRHVSEVTFLVASQYVLIEV